MDIKLDIDMSIDEVIEHATADVEFYENQLESLKREGYVISDTANKQIYDAIRYNKSIIRLLGDLKILRLNSCMIHLPERLQLVENGYNKAIYDAKGVILQTLDNEILVDTLNLRLEQLKAGGKNDD